MKRAQRNNWSYIDWDSSTLYHIGMYYKKNTLFSSTLKRAKSKHSLNACDCGNG